MLSLDVNVQEIAERYLNEAIAANTVENRGCAIVMNVKTGAILAMASKPDFDPNDPLDYSANLDYLNELVHAEPELYGIYKKDENGNVVEVYAEYDPETKGGNTPDGRKVRGTIHWVDANNCLDAEVRLYDNLFTVPDPDTGDRNFLDYLNENSLEVLTGCKAEKNIAGATAPKSYQFMRHGYFCIDNKDSSPEHLVFNRSVSLKDSFKK